MIQVFGMLRSVWINDYRNFEGLWCLHLQVLGVQEECLFHCFTLKMKVLRFFETSVSILANDKV